MMAKQIDLALREFGSWQVLPPQEVVDNGKSKAQSIFDLLQQESRFSLDRFIIGGSVGKKTAVREFDLDLIVFVNGVTPPFTKVIEDFEEILESERGNDEGEDIWRIRTSPFSVQFTYDDFDIDLLPAVNLISQADLGGQEVIDLQTTNVLTQMQKHYPHKQGRYFSSSLTESQVQFMKHQSSFVHQLVRICKFWNKTLFIDEVIPGRKTLLELVAVKAGIDQEQFQKPSMLYGFKGFLLMMQDFDNLNVWFVTRHVNPYNHAPRKILHQRPLVLEPANPFNNLAKGVSPWAQSKFAEFASESLRRFDTAFNGMTESYVPLDLFFRVQKSQEGFFDTSPSLCLVSVIHLDEDYSCNQPLSVDLNDGEDLDILDFPVCKFVQQSLFAALDSYIHSRQRTLESDEVETLVERWIDRNVYFENGRDADWWESNQFQDHETYSVTFNIPFSITGSREYDSLLKVSMDFNDDEDDEDSSYYTD